MSCSFATATLSLFTPLILLYRLHASCFFAAISDSDYQRRRRYMQLLHITTAMPPVLFIYARRDATPRHAASLRCRRRAELPRAADRVRPYG